MGKRRKSKKGDLTVFNDDRNEDCEGAVRHYKPLPDKIEKGPYETQQQFIRRLNRLVGKAMGEAEIEQKYDVDFCPKSGKNEFDEVFKTARTISKKKQEKRRERDRKRKVKKNAKKQLNHNEFDKFKSKVEFGDVVHQPPDLDKIKKKFDETLKKMKNKESKVKHFA